MSNSGASALVLWLLGLTLCGCSLAGPSERNFKPAVLEKGDVETDEERVAAKLKLDRETCQSEAKMRGISSVLSIIRSADKRNTDAQYVSCMQKKGYKVEGEAVTPPVQSQ